MCINESIGVRIRSQRERLGLKQINVANALQVSPQAVSKWERGENAPDISTLAPLAKLLAISTDQLLGVHEDYNEETEATVFVSDIAGYTHKIQSMRPEDVAVWTNGFLFQLTEICLRYDGIPIKYIGDGLLCFFAGADHQKRAILAARNAKKVISETLHIGLSSGIIYPCALGHPDYAQSDIMGTSVNVAFLTSQLACERDHTDSGIFATHSVVKAITDLNGIGPKVSVNLKGLDDPIDVHEIMCEG